MVRIINKIQFLYFIFKTQLYELQQLAVSKENYNGLQNRYSISRRNRDFLFTSPPRPVADINLSALELGISIEAQHLCKT